MMHQGAIFASIGLTALQLPNINDVNWSARACCSSSMVLGLASVITAARQHQAVGMLNSPLNVRLWLSRGKPKPYRRLPRVRAFLMADDNTDEKDDKYYHDKTFHDLPLESSISAMKAIALPRHLLDLAVLVFLVGFGLYILFSWLSDVDEGRTYLNILIVFIVTAGAHKAYDFLVEVARAFDDDKRNDEFSTNTLGGFQEPEKLWALQKKLDEVQQRMKSELPTGQEPHQGSAGRQQDPENMADSTTTTSRTTPVWVVNNDVSNSSSLTQKPEHDPHTAQAPAAARDNSRPTPSTDRSAPPPCQIDKYQAWQHYLTSYLKTQTGSDYQFLVNRIMQLRGNFEGGWDVVASMEQDIKAEDRDTT